jgi:Sulfotransferase family
MNSASAAGRVEVDTLLAKARAAAGLTDFGDTWFLEPLTKLVKAINTEGNLKSPDEPPIERIVYGLMDRLKKHALLQQHPEILDEEIHVAGAILGLPRTGSTMLQRLLGSAPQLTSGYWWEVTFPLPFPGEAWGDPSPRQEAAKAAVDAFYAAWPDFRSIHPMDAMEHDEEVILLDKNFLSTTYESILNVPSFGFWMARQDKTRSYQELHTWLQILQWQSPWRRGRKWILKSPHHLLGGLQGLLDVFPEAHVIMTHRSVSETAPSYCSMCSSMMIAHTREIDPHAIGAHWNQRFQDGMRNLIKTRETAPPARFIDVRYRDMVEDPIAQALQVMVQMGLTPTAADEQAMNAWLAKNGRETRPPHHYVAEDFGLSQAQMDRDFAFYTDTYLR